MARSKEDANSIEIRMGAAGPNAYVGKSRIRVIDIARMYELFHEDAIVGYIVRSLPSLTESQVHDAIKYWRAHHDEIARLIEDEDALLETIPYPAPSR